MGMWQIQEFEYEETEVVVPLELIFVHWEPKCFIN